MYLLVCFLTLQFRFALFFISYFFVPFFKAVSCHFFTNTLLFVSFFYVNHFLHLVDMLIFFFITNLDFIFKMLYNNIYFLLFYCFFVWHIFKQLLVQFFAVLLLFLVVCFPVHSLLLLHSDYLFHFNVLLLIQLKICASLRFLFASSSSSSSFRSSFLGLVFKFIIC